MTVKKTFMGVLIIPVFIHGLLVTLIGVALFLVDVLKRASWVSAPFDHDLVTAMLVLLAASYLLLSERLIRDKGRLAPAKKGASVSEGDRTLSLQFVELYKYTRTLYHSLMICFLLFYVTLHVPPPISRRNTFIYNIELFGTVALYLEFLICYLKAEVLCRRAAYGAQPVRRKWASPEYSFSQSALRFLQVVLVVGGCAILILSWGRNIDLLPYQSNRWAADGLVILIGLTFIGIDLHHKTFMKSQAAAQRSAEELYPGLV